jgi:hypothetical protein
MKERLQALLVEHGVAALSIYWVIFVVVLLGSAAAIRCGVKVRGLSGSATVWGGAYLATKLAQPLRIIATLALTPPVAALFRRRSSKTRMPDGTRRIG